MIPHQPGRYITRRLQCDACHEQSLVRMERYLLRYDWPCPSCGSMNHFQDHEASMVFNDLTRVGIKK